MYGNTHEWWECHQAFLQLDVNRLVLYRQLLVIDVKDAPCTLRRPVSEMFMPIGRSNTISIREMNCWNHSLWTWQRLYMTLRIWIQTTWFHHELVLRFLLISASHVDIPATRVAICYLHSWLLQKWIPNPETVRTVNVILRKSLFYNVLQSARCESCCKSSPITGWQPLPRLFGLPGPCEIVFSWIRMHSGRMKQLSHK